MAVLLALLSAALYGAADFLGGIATRRAHVTAIVTIAQGSGLLLLTVLLPLLPTAAPIAADLLWGSAAGLAGGIGVGLLYQGFAVGSMALVAPVSAICAVVIPAVASMALGERPGALTLAGMGIALMAIALVSQTPAPPAAADARPPSASRWPAGLGIALMSGVAIGFFFLCLAQTRREAALWPLLVARLTSTVAFGLGAVVTRVPLVWPRAVFGVAVFGGVLDMVANALYLFAARRGSLSVVVTLVSLYPASTVVLARGFLGERVTPVQGVGIALALVAVVLIVVGN